MNIHPDITADRVIEAVERHNTTLDNPGFCVRCGADADSVEPDARGYHCDACGEPGVHGAEELLIMMV
jgi:predicted amidophosphoribosyltransferase